MEAVPVQIISSLLQVGPNHCQTSITTRWHGIEIFVPSFKMSHRERFVLLATSRYDHPEQHRKIEVAFTSDIIVSTDGRVLDIAIELDRKAFKRAWYWSRCRIKSIGGDEERERINIPQAKCTATCTKYAIYARMCTFIRGRVSNTRVLPHTIESSIFTCIVIMWYFTCEILWRDARRHVMYKMMNWRGHSFEKLRVITRRV